MSTKAKKENWKADEIDVLLERVDKRQAILFGKHSSFVSNDRIKVQWQEITNGVNAVSNTERTVDEV